ncbi:TPA: hypothetical protein VCC39_000614 [Streptococcus pyogenes]|nr:hypothetical protein [Streptococcus pyogenes]
MDYLMIGIIVLSVVIFIMGFFILYYQAIIVNSMKNDFRRMRKELREELEQTKANVEKEINKLNGG